ncbi:MAG TPA: DUF1572 family protein [Cyclobacteriaceae bacterium]|nr:DUF1572 family protein [Cyclobacteriaceae bacterium]MCB9237965.1 DUF1572 family protein [Flammeovirgaceae bacterium]MCB0499195.1 DUF1572 family protein [Cyclobacteriaceae bacterium]MCO5271884.1 DUF1572 domain-containing protein [Cyclobacteriaceae bacterium]MCW5901711.1 DUF1572 family protein [Cyclobacteriaceae bacterium]
MPTTANPGFLKSTIQVFTNYKGLGEKTFDQLTDAQLQWKPNASSNSIALIVHHLSGNMLSRWTDFLTSDGEKPWRDREAEFETGYADRASMMEAWDKGWECLLSALKGLGPEDLGKTIYIRNEGHTVVEAVQRQLAHYASHIGQIMFIGKLIKDSGWKSLSIPKGGTREFNAGKFGQPKK